MVRVLDYLPRGDRIDGAGWQRRHRIVLVVLLAQAPITLVVGLAVGDGLTAVLVMLLPLAAAAGAWFTPGRRDPSLVVAAGLTLACLGLVFVSGGSVEAHFSFFVITAFLLLYQHWLPIAVELGTATLGLWLAAWFAPSALFDHPVAQQSPWLWSLIVLSALVLACLGALVSCRIGEDEQARRDELATAAGAEARQQGFTSELLLNLARRNQSAFHRQLEIVNDLEERERDPDALADLFRLEHLATRVRRNAESLLVLSGEQPARVWSAPVALRDVVRAGVAETEDLDRVTLAVDERPEIAGRSVADLTHIVAELVENAARYSPAPTPVVVQSRIHPRVPGAVLLTIEDSGIGMPPPELGAANELLSNPQAVDVSAAARCLGFHVVSRLAERHGIEVSLTPTPGCGVTAVLLLPAALFADATPTVPAVGFQGLQPVPAPAVPSPRRGSADSVSASGGGTAPAGTSSLLEGRHSWPGGGSESAASTDRESGAGSTDGTRVQRSAHAADDGGATQAGSDGTTAHEPAAAATADDGYTTVEVVPPSGGHTDRGDAARRSLIHPMAVPPPVAGAESAGAGDGVPRGATSAAEGVAEGTTPETTAEPAAPAPRRSSGRASAMVTPSGLVLARRRPQAHLAPELVRPTGATDRAAGSQRRPGPPSPGQGVPNALSAYQASRAAACSEIGKDQPIAAPGPIGPSGDDHPDHGTTTGGQT